jgi:gamma-glutamylcyclotransferase (GGCT)/AIG2-like uncharacterized protein YtfP
MKINSINKFFVYGTLRPDIKAPWSDIVHNNSGFKLKYYKAKLYNSKLFFHKKFGYPMTIYDNKKYLNEEHFTIGYILETDNIELTLEIFDEIEEYPNMYDRILVKCYNQTLSIEEEVYFYTLHPDNFNHEDLEDLKVNDYRLINK